MRPGYPVEAAREAIAAIGPGAAGRVVCRRAEGAGHRRPVGHPAGQWQLYPRTGVSHLMSISGLHVTMLSGLVCAGVLAVAACVRLTLRLPARRAAVVAGALTALVYVLLAGFAVPAQRTLYMLLVVALALWSGRTLAPTRVKLGAAGRGVARPVGGLVSRFLAVVRCGGGDAVGHHSAGGQAALAARLVGAAMGGDAGAGTGVAVAIWTVFADFAARQRIRHSVGEFRHYAAGLLGSMPGMDWALHAAHSLMAGCVWLLTWLAQLPWAVAAARARCGGRCAGAGRRGVAVAAARFPGARAGGGVVLPVADARTAAAAGGAMAGGAGCGAGLGGRGTHRAPHAAIRHRPALQRRIR